MRTISIPPTTPPSFGETGETGKPELPVAMSVSTTTPHTLAVVWIPPLEPFNPFEGATDDLIDGLVEHIEAPRE